MNSCTNLEEAEVTKAQDSGRAAADQPRVGRPSGCTPEAVGLLRGVIRELGLSDSAAARRLGIGASTLSRWKREDPEVRLLLQQAREECRAVQLQNIMKSAAAEHGRGWRAAAWLLERLFPEDYSPHAGAREGHRSVAEARALREEQAAEAEERAARLRRACAVFSEEAAQDAAFAQEEDCRNCRNSVESTTRGEAASGLAGVAQCFQPVGGSGAFGGAELLETPKAEDDDFTREDDCRNCRNSTGEASTGRMPAALDPPTGKMPVPPHPSSGKMPSPPFLPDDGISASRHLGTSTPCF